MTSSYNVAIYTMKQYFNLSSATCSPWVQTIGLIYNPSDIKHEACTQQSGKCAQE